MFNTHNSDTERGQVGIGTLIVFIAMVLVAAIAAGVLVNTAGFLQSTAEETGQQSVDQVTNRIDVISQHGFVNNTDNATGVDQLNLAVRISSGSNEISLNSTTIKYTSDSTAENLVYNNSSNYDATSDITQENLSALGSNEFAAVDKNDNGESYPVLDEDNDRFELVINASNVEGNGEGLKAGSSLNLEITTRSGGTTNVVVSMPNTLENKDNNEPVPL